VWRTARAIAVDRARGSHVGDNGSHVGPGVVHRVESVPEIHVRVLLRRDGVPRADVFDRPAVQVVRAGGGIEQPGLGPAAHSCGDDGEQAAEPAHGFSAAIASASEWANPFG
jgi:hypothetical protein